MSDLNDARSPPPVTGDVPSQDDKTMAMLVHLSGIILGFIVPLIVWLVNKDVPNKGYLNDQAKEALNFQITIAIAYVAGVILTIILIGPLISMAAWIVSVVFSIVAALKAKDGVAYRYPFALRLVN